MSMNLEMGRGRIVDYTPSVADEWIEATNAVYAYQAGIQKRIAEIKAAARKDRVENAGRLQAEEEARRREAERQAEYEQRRERVEKNYEWLSPSQARTQLQSDLTNVRSSHYGFDDSNFPSVIRQQDARRMLVESMTKWYRVNVKVKSEQDKYEIMNANYRFMKAKVEDSTTVQFYLQYALKVDFDAMSGQLQLAPTVTVVEEETNKEYTGTNTYRLDAPWFGSMIGLIEITPELLINGVGDVKITAEVK